MSPSSSSATPTPTSLPFQVDISMLIEAVMEINEIESKLKEARHEAATSQSKAEDSQQCQQSQAGSNLYCLKQTANNLKNIRQAIQDKKILVGYQQLHQTKLSTIYNHIRGERHQHQAVALDIRELVRISDDNHASEIMKGMGGGLPADSDGIVKEEQQVRLRDYYNRINSEKQAWLRDYHYSQQRRLVVKDGKEEEEEEVLSELDALIEDQMRALIIKGSPYSSLALR